MKAKAIPRIDIYDRVELKNALPLRTPYVIYIDPCGHPMSSTSTPVIPATSAVSSVPPVIWN